MARQYLGTEVFEEALNRLVSLMEEGHRLVVSVSGGKDSTVVMELTCIAAQLASYPRPVDVVMRDEEIMFPGTFEYCERVAERDDLNFHWIIAGQPVINAFNRESPYWWVFDDRHEDLWVRQPPSYAEWIDEKNIEAMVVEERFPIDHEAGQKLYDVIGLRASESRGRLFGIYSSKGWLTKPRKQSGVSKARPIYDWSDADVWKAIHDNKWDYNHAYDTLYRLGVERKKLRIAPPTMNAAGIPLLKPASQAWPQWFDKVCERCPGVRTAAQYGMRAVTPSRRVGENWQDTFERACVRDAPKWVAERAIRVRDRILHQHARHSTAALPEVNPCWQCTGDVGCWKHLSWFLFLGDPFCIKTGSILKPVEPEFFREGAGIWNGTPAFT